MKAVLPLIPNAAPTASAEAGVPREAARDGETFASVLDRRSLAGKARMENGDATCAESEVTDTAATELPRQKEEGEAEETVLALPPPTLVWPALPFHPVEEPRFPWSPIAGDAPPLEVSDENSADATDAGISGTEEPAQYAATISAGPSQSLPILTAMFPIPMAQLAVQLRGRTETATREITVPAAASESTVAALPSVAGFAPAVRSVLESSVAALPIGAEFAPTMRAVPESPAGGRPMVAESAGTERETPKAAASALPAASGLVPQVARDTTLPAPLPQRERTAVTTAMGGASPQRHDPLRPLAAFTEPTEVAQAPSPDSAHPTVETLLVESAPQPHGTPAAKRGEVMQAIAFQASPKPRVAKSADPLVTLLESAELPAAAGAGPTPATSGIQAIAPAPTTDAVTRKTPDHRVAKESRFELREAPSAGVQAGAGLQAESSATHFGVVQPATTVDPASRKESEHQPGAELRVEFDASVPASFQAARPHADRVTAEAVTTEAPITRVELVQIVERTADAAVRMRAVGSERVEVAVQLESGDRLTIELRIANGEVTPHFRTSSEGLRTALEQNWAQFFDRAGDRGVRLTPPVFDVNQSSSNMTDLSQQRHGRHAAYTDAQAELFPHLPRRARPAHVRASASLESSSAITAGVRTYA